MEPTVTIRNRTTGEVKQVPQSQLGSFGVDNSTPAPIAQPTPPTSGGGGFSNLLPLLGGIAGSFIGSPILGGAIGAGLGTLGKQAIQGKGNPGEVVTQAALAGAGGIGGKLLGGLLGHVLPGALDTAGEGAIASQYNVPRNVARAINFPQSIKDLTKYGITDASKIPDIAGQVTGDSGVISQLTRRAVAKANPVPLGSYETANGSVPAVADMAQNLVSNPSITSGTEGKFMSFIKKGLDKTMGGEAGNITGTANPSETFGFIQQLEKQAAGITRGRAPSAITAEDQALANAYKSVADELRHRLFSVSGADQAVATGLATPEELKSLSAIHPQLAQDVQGAQTVGDLRGIAAPFVQANKAAAETNAASQFGFQNLAGQAKGIGKAVPTLGNPLAPIQAGLSSSGVNATLGKGALKAADLLRGLPLPSAATLSRAGVATGAGLGAGDSTSTPTDNSQPIEGQVIDPGGNVGTGDNSTRDPLRTALGIYAMQHAKSVNDLVAGYNLLNPKPANGTVDRAASLKVGENVVDRAMQSLTGYGPVQGRLYQLQLSLGGGAGVPNDVVKTNTSFNLLRQSVVRALQGARMSDADIKIAEGYTPSLTDTPQTVQQKLGVLKQILTETRQYLQSTNQQYDSPPSQSSGVPLPAGYTGLGQ